MRMPRCLTTTIPARSTRRLIVSIGLRNADGATPTADLRLEMQRTMQEDAAVFRTSKTLKEGVKKMDEIRRQA